MNKNPTIDDIDYIINGHYIRHGNQKTMIENIAYGITRGCNVDMYGRGSRLVGLRTIKTGSVSYNVVSGVRTDDDLKIIK